MADFDKKEELVWIAKRIVAMDVLFGRIATYYKVGEGSKFVYDIPANSSYFHPEELGCQAQTGHNDIQYQPENDSAYFMIPNRLEKRKFNVFWQGFITMSTAKKKQNGSVDNVLDGVVRSTTLSVFVENQYEQYAGAEWLGCQILCFHVYFVPKYI